MFYMLSGPLCDRIVRDKGRCKFVRIRGEAVEIGVQAGHTMQPYTGSSHLTDVTYQTENGWGLV
ncbi:hypothetical protein TH25_14185 [Thalassospira profundimaris]|uniref:Uncharacterized protein n=1 Tax=Thalassospira profundimaris TaxID=502049 RepID=A0A367X6M4_9PROT|nr:hypothetical protein TH25_14185 [Thalassospira profundimaris]